MRFGVFETAWCGSIHEALGWIEAENRDQAYTLARQGNPGVPYLKVIAEVEIVPRWQAALAGTHPVGRLDITTAIRATVYADGSLGVGDHWYQNVAALVTHKVISKRKSYVVATQVKDLIKSYTERY